jgi:sugar lactone lactonase YvrE
MKSLIFLQPLCIYLWGLLFFFSTATKGASSSGKSISTVYQFSNAKSWVEGIAIRPNGQILVTRTDVPELWLIDPKAHSASLVYTFPDATSTVGIAAISPDVYAVGAGIVDLATTVATPGSFVIWTVDLRKHTPNVKILKAIPESQSLSGMALYRSGRNSSVLLVADTAKGVIWRLNPQSGAYSVAISDPTMLPVPNLPPIGINGIKVLGNTLFYTSSTQQVYCQVALNPDGSAAAPVKVIASGFFQDGFTIRSDGTAFIATHPQNTILKVTLDGQTSVFAGDLNSTAVAGSTDVQFGNFKGQEVLYVTTNGAQSAPVNGTFTEPGKVVMVQGC